MFLDIGKPILGEALPIAHTLHVNCEFYGTPDRWVWPCSTFRYYGDLGVLLRSASSLEARPSRYSWSLSKD